MQRDTVQVTLNFMGSPVSEDFPASITDGALSPAKSVEHALAESFFSLPLSSLPKDVLKRYAELSDKSLYLPFLPHTDKLFERLLLPFKSAKRCYCLGEFLAAIELCAHVGEMLAQLVWEMAPLSRDPADRCEEIEVAFFGSKFERLGQERRLKILSVTRRISAEQLAAFDFLRTVRRKYFHLWSESVDGIEKDAKDCFYKLNYLVRGILQIDISPDNPGKLVVNPVLSRYLDRVHDPSNQRIDRE